MFPLGALGVLVFFFSPRVFYGFSLGCPSLGVPIGFPFLSQGLSIGFPFWVVPGYPLVVP